eukprot:TRINITY_DN496_c2_g1_i2.p1 TRINITY_DN496_c2_g1~~TRINITY_DN496_c2_g1_i2.p1  ORF type:complete len:1543 (-),score=345.89 TRINITY_DN496_c2_g1_i2:477-5105(-)
MNTKDLLEAIYFNDIEAVEKVLKTITKEQLISIHDTGLEQSPFLFASTRGNTLILSSILDTGLIDANHKHYTQAVINASKKPDPNILSILLSYGGPKLRSDLKSKNIDRVGEAKTVWDYFELSPPQAGQDISASISYPYQIYKKSSANSYDLQRDTSLLMTESLKSSLTNLLSIFIQDPAKRQAITSQVLSISNEDGYLQPTQQINQLNKISSDCSIQIERICHLEKPIIRIQSYIKAWNVKNDKVANLISPYTDAWIKFIESERFYLSSLKYLKRTYLMELKNNSNLFSISSLVDGNGMIQKLFINLDQIIEFQTKFLYKLEALDKYQPIYLFKFHQLLLNEITNNEHFWSIYGLYIGSLMECMDTWKSLLSTKERHGSTTSGDKNMIMVANTKLINFINEVQSKSFDENSENVKDQVENNSTLPSSSPHSLTLPTLLQLPLKHIQSYETKLLKIICNFLGINLDNNASPIQTGRAMLKKSAKEAGNMNSHFSSDSTGADGKKSKLKTSETNIPLQPTAASIAAQFYEHIDSSNVQGATDILKNYEQLIDVNAHIPPKNQTALHKACAAGSLPIVKLLVKHNAKFDVQDSQLWYPIHSAAIYGQFSIINYLIKKGHDANLKNIDLNTALHYVVRNKLSESIEKTLNILLKANADVNSVNRFGDTPLHTAISRGGGIDVSLYLLKKGASLDIRNTSGLSALEVAYSKKESPGLIVALETYILQSIEHFPTFKQITVTLPGGDKKSLPIQIPTTSNSNNNNAPNQSATNTYSTATLRDVIQRIFEPKNLSIQEHVYYDANNKLLSLDTPSHTIERGEVIAVKTTAASVELNKKIFTVHFGAGEKKTVMMLPDKPLKDALSKVLQQRGMNTSDYVASDSQGVPGPSNIIGWDTIMGKIEKHEIYLSKVYGSAPPNLPPPPLPTSGSTNLSATADGETVEDFVKAAETGNLAKINQYLKSSKLDINSLTSDKRQSAIHAAASKGHTDVVKQLIKNHANVNLTNDQKWTPLHSASISSHYSVVNLLLRKNADPNRANIDSNTALHYLVRGKEWNEKFQKTLENIIKNGAKLDSVNKMMETALHASVQHGHIEITRFLVKRGAQVDFKNIRGFSPLDQAVEFGYTEIAELLRNSKSLIHHNSTPSSSSSSTQTSQSFSLHYDDLFTKREADGNNKVLITENDWENILKSSNTESLKRAGELWKVTKEMMMISNKFHLYNNVPSHKAFIQKLKGKYLLSLMKDQIPHKDLPPQSCLSDILVGEDEVIVKGKESTSNPSNIPISTSSSTTNTSSSSSSSSSTSSKKSQYCYVFQDFLVIAKLSNSSSPSFVPSLPTIPHQSSTSSISVSSTNSSSTSSPASTSLPSTPVTIRSRTDSVSQKNVLTTHNNYQHNLNYYTQSTITKTSLKVKHVFPLKYTTIEKEHNPSTTEVSFKIIYLDPKQKENNTNNSNAASNTSNPNTNASGTVSSKGSTIIDISCRPKLLNIISMQIAANSTQILGVELEKLANRSDTIGGIPAILRQTIHQERGIVEGIFRLSGSASKIAALNH